MKDLKKKEVKIRVNCHSCGMFDEDKVKRINIEEDELGRDKVTFECPSCKQVITSLKYTKQ